MRRLVLIVAVVGLLGARAAHADDAHAQMAEALAAQIDHPTPVTLPATAKAPQHAASQSAVKRGVGPQAAAAAARADQAKAQGQAQAAAHQAAAAAAAAAGQAQAQEARERAKHPHPTPQTH